MEKGTTVPITPEMNAKLKELKAKLHAAGMSGRLSNPEIVEGLIDGANRSPIEAVKAVIETHVSAQGAALLDDASAERHP